jgi:hypothetical protein
MENKNRGGRPKNDVWQYFERTNVTADGHARATCKFCGDARYRGEKALMEGHLANHCNKAPGYVIREYLKENGKNEKNGNEITSSNNKKRKTVKNSQTMLEQSFHQIEELTSGCIDRINQALVKAFVCCSIAFQIVENPFFVEFIKELNPSYKLPSREVLSGRLIEEELSKVNYKVFEELQNENNLTLGKIILSEFK